MNVPELMYTRFAGESADVAPFPLLNNRETSSLRFIELSVNKAGDPWQTGVDTVKLETIGTGTTMLLNSVQVASVTGSKIVSLIVCDPGGEINIGGGNAVVESIVDVVTSNHCQL